VFEPIDFESGATTNYHMLIHILLLLAPLAFGTFSTQIDNYALAKSDLSKIDTSFMNSYRNFCSKSEFSAHAARKAFLKKHSAEVGEKLSLQIESQVRKALNSINSKLPSSDHVKLRVVLLFGCEKTDATALLGHNETFVFFDIFTLFNQGRQSKIDKVFVVHELLHGIHFARHPEFAPLNYHNPSDHLMKYLINEGAATYFAQKITGASDKDTYWPGHFDNSQYLVWKKFAQNEKKKFAERIQRYLHDAKTEPHLLKDLFYVLEFKDLEHKRPGYLYGAAIVRNFDKKNNKGLNFSYKDIAGEIKNYFSLD
jgi:uncharacterized protein YjaZ